MGGGDGRRVAILVCEGFKGARDAAPITTGPIQTVEPLRP